MAESEEFQADPPPQRPKPFRPPRVRPQPDDGEEVDLRSIATYQKGILFCILANLLLIPLHFALPSDAKLFLVLAAAPISITATVFVFLLATKVYSPGVGVLLGLLTLIPLVGLIVLLIINGKATGILNKHGIRVGLLGARMSDFAEAPAERPRPRTRRRDDDEERYQEPDAPVSTITAEPPVEHPRPSPRPRPRPRFDDDDEDRFRRSDDPVSTVIPYKNPKALIAYYCGVFGLIPCVGAVLGPAALVLGILGLRYVKQHPTAKGTGHAIAGIVLGIIDLYNWALVILLVAYAAMAKR